MARVVVGMASTGRRAGTLRRMARARSHDASRAFAYGNPERGLALLRDAVAHSEEADRLERHAKRVALEQRKYAMALEGLLEIANRVHANERR